jgi:hypothetical protein
MRINTGTSCVQIDTHRHVHHRQTEPIFEIRKHTESPLMWLTPVVTTHN